MDKLARLYVEAEDFGAHWADSDNVAKTMATSIKSLLRRAYEAGREEANEETD